MPGRNPSKPDEAKRSRVRDAIRTGQYDHWSVSGTAKELGVSQHTVRLAVADLGHGPGLGERVTFLSRWGRLTEMDTTRINKPTGIEWEDAAVQEGLPPEFLHSRAEEIIAEAKAKRDQVIELRKQVRDRLGHGRFTAIISAAARGQDAAGVEGLDVLAAELCPHFPDVLGTAKGEEATARLHELIVAGKPPPVDRDECYDQALRQLLDYRQQWAA